jgi:hypothetical protein
VELDWSQAVLHTMTVSIKVMNVQSPIYPSDKSPSCPAIEALQLIKLTVCQSE